MVIRCYHHGRRGGWGTVKVAHKQEEQHAGCTEELPTKSQGIFPPSTTPCTSNFFSVTRETVNRSAVLSCPLIKNYVLHWRQMKVGLGSLFCFYEVGGGGALNRLLIPLADKQTAPTAGKIRVYKTASIVLAVLCALLLLAIIALVWKREYLQT